MTLSIYGKDLLLGMWPWGTLSAARSLRELDCVALDSQRDSVADRWGKSAREVNSSWTLRKRLFTTPAVSDVDAPWSDFVAKRNRSLPAASVNGWCVTSALLCPGLSSRRQDLRNAQGTAG